MDRPIIFSTEMVRAILQGRKTQTRRVINLREFGPSDTMGYDWNYRCKRALWQDYKHEDFLKKCPYGKIGDLLYVRETYAIDDWVHSTNRGAIVYKTQNIDPDYPIKWKPSIHMPKKYARLWLEIVDIRVERLQEISEDDILKEGIENHSLDVRYFKFESLWNSINEKRGYGWNTNPRVWVIEFKKL